MKTTQRPRKYYVIALVSLTLLCLNIYAVRAFIIFGSPILFSTALFLELVSAIIFIYSTVRILSKPENIIKSLLQSAWDGLASNDYVKKVINSKSPVLVWFRSRFKTGNPYGLPLTITLLITVSFFVSFLSVLIKVILKSSITNIDIRILNLMPSIRTPIQTTFFKIVTTLANTETVILLLVIIAAIFWRQKQRIMAGLVLLTGAGEESVTYIIKFLVKRMRPERALRLIREDSYSYPSGHAVRATVLFGLLAYLIIKSYTKTRTRITVFSVYVLSVFLVAISRIYLGVHYPSDVIGGMLLGIAMLTLVVGIVETASRYKFFGQNRIVILDRSLAIVPAVLILFAIIASSFFVRIQPIMTTPAFITIQKVDNATIKQFPLYSETLSGSRMEPINFIYIGYESDIESLFINHSWYKADPSTLNNTLKALAVGFQGGQYLTAPVTPSYLNFKPENLAFEQSTATHSLRQRHHTRLWRTDFALPDGRPIWVATASFDEGIEFAGVAKLPTHHIDPNIDTERDYIVNSLSLKNIHYLQVVNAQAGKNASGDTFFTDGKAVLTEL